MKEYPPTPKDKEETQEDKVRGGMEVARELKERLDEITEQLSPQEQFETLVKNGFIDKERAHESGIRFDKRGFMRIVFNEMAAGRPIKRADAKLLLKKLEEEEPGNYVRVIDEFVKNEIDPSIKNPEELRQIKKEPGGDGSRFGIDPQESWSKSPEADMDTEDEPYFRNKVRGIYEREGDMEEGRHEEGEKASSADTPEKETPEIGVDRKTLIKSSLERALEKQRYEITQIYPLIPVNDGYKLEVDIKHPELGTENVFEVNIAIDKNFEVTNLHFKKAEGEVSEVERNKLSADLEIAKKGVNKALDLKTSRPLTKKESGQDQSTAADEISEGAADTSQETSGNVIEASSNFDTSEASTERALPDLIRLVEKKERIFSALRNEHPYILVSHWSKYMNKPAIQIFEGKFDRKTPEGNALDDFRETLEKLSKRSGTRPIQNNVLGHETLYNWLNRAVSSVAEIRLNEEKKESERDEIGDDAKKAA